MDERFCKGRRGAGVRREKRRRGPRPEARGSAGPVAVPGPLQEAALRFPGLCVLLPCARQQGTCAKVVFLPTSSYAGSSRPGVTSFSFMLKIKV